MKIAIYSRGIENDQNRDMDSFLAELYANKMEPVFFQGFFNQFYSSVNIKGKYSTFSSADDLDESVDFMISLGGDGTLLDTVSLVQDKGIPVLGINYGRLGFLANIGKEDMHSAIKALVERTYVIEKRTLIHLDADIPVFKNIPYSLNEFTLQKKDSSSMIKIHTYLNGEFLNTYWADGLIVATPTGSTGYSLSCNGPIVIPTAENFVITPIAPHNLNVRPIVVSDSSVISFEIEGRNENFFCTLDSRTEAIDTSVQLAVKKCSFTMNLVRLSDHHFLDTLRRKLMWGADVRK